MANTRLCKRSEYLNLNISLILFTIGNIFIIFRFFSCIKSIRILICYIRLVLILLTFSTYLYYFQNYTLIGEFECEASVSFLVV